HSHLPSKWQLCSSCFGRRWWKWMFLRGSPTSHQLSDQRSGPLRAELRISSVMCRGLLVHRSRVCSCKASPFQPHWRWEAESKSPTTCCCIVRLKKSIRPKKDRQARSKPDLTLRTTRIDKRLRNSSSTLLALFSQYVCGSNRRFTLSSKR